VSSTTFGPAKRRIAQRNADEPALVTRAKERLGAVIRCAEQIDRVSRRRSVDHDQVVVIAGPQLMQPFDGHVLLCAAQRPGDAAIDRVAEDGLGALFVPGAVDDQAVERGLGIEHLGPQRTGGMIGRATDFARFVSAIGRVDAQGVGEPLCRIDGDDNDLAAEAGGDERERRGHAGLADPTGPAGDDQFCIAENIG
jgi:hypothetical protein